MNSMYLGMPSQEEWERAQAHIAELEAKVRDMEWRPIETAPKEETVFIGIENGLVYSTHWQKYYEKWPHEEGGPTYTGGWSAETFDAHIPFRPTHWMPLPPAPTNKKEHP